MTKERKAISTHGDEPSGSNDLHGPITITLTDDYIEELERLAAESARWESEVEFEEWARELRPDYFSETRLEGLRAKAADAKARLRLLEARPVIVAMWQREGELRRQASMASE
ncbi:MAG TPA: hypothetical protein VEZ14_11975 [Dehalococcoidia bacterium]|nr:hypothetical protein [Dehalococcoidia bacterium]